MVHNCVCLVRSADHLAATAELWRDAIAFRGFVLGRAAGMSCFKQKANLVAQNTPTSCSCHACGFSVEDLHQPGRGWPEPLKVRFEVFRNRRCALRSALTPNHQPADSFDDTCYITTRIYGFRHKRCFVDFLQACLNRSCRFFEHPFSKVWFGLTIVVSLLLRLHGWIHSTEDPDPKA